MGFITAGVYKAEGVVTPWDLQFDKGSFLIEGKVDDDKLSFSSKTSKGGYIYIKYEGDVFTIEQEKEWPLEEIGDFIKSKPVESEAGEGGETEIEYTLDFIVFPLYHIYTGGKEYENSSQIKGSNLKYTKLVPDSNLTSIQSIFSVKREGEQQYDLILAPKLVSSFGFDTPKE